MRLKRLSVPQTQPNASGPGNSAPPPKPTPKEEGWWNRWGSDALHTTLDVVGLIPGVGEVADGANALVYLAEGDKVSAALSAAAMLPIGGQAATAAKMAKKGAQALEKQAAKKAAEEAVEHSAKEAAEKAAKEKLEREAAEKAKDLARPSAGGGINGPRKRVEDHATFGEAITDDYRGTFFAANPDLQGQVIVHHAVEQQVLTRYPGLVSTTEVHSLENLRGIPTELNSDIHLSKIRREWNEFYRKTPSPTKEMLLQKATEIDKKFGSQFIPPRGK